MSFATVDAKFSQFVVHNGMLICFSYVKTAINPTTSRIAYSILRVDEPGHSTDDLWSDFELVNFPTAIRPVGMQLIALKAGDTNFAAADTPFQVITDTQYIYLFRQSTSNTLLVDRFVLDEVSMKLDFAWEVRYRRSQKIDLPADRKDTFGTTNMNGERFVEPTTELTMIGNLQSGGFGVQVLPTDVAGVERWLILAWNSATKAIDNWSLLRSDNGLFDLTDSIDPITKQVTASASYTPPSSLTFASGPAVLTYQRQEWLEDDKGVHRLYGRSTRVMVASPTLPDNKTAILDFAVGKNGRIAGVTGVLPIASAPTPTTALSFNGAHQTQVTVGALTGASATTATFECWVRASQGGTGVVPIFQSASSPMTLLLATQNGAPVFSAGGVSVGGPQLEVGQWTHLAGVRDTSGVTLYVNGQPYTASVTLTAPTAPAAGYRFGGAGGFAGELQEARLWNTARTRADILAHMTGVIASNDPSWSSLIGYWRMIEPGESTRLTTMANSAGAGTAGDGVLSGAYWTPSTAPTAPSMTPVAWDANNLDVSTCLLDFALSSISPSLVAASDGSLRLYQQQAGGKNLTAAHFSTLQARARYSVPWTSTAAQTADNQTGLLHFLARTPGTGMVNPAVSPAYVQITPNPIVSGQTPTGTVTFTSNTGIVEVWPQVPLEIATCAQVINGEALQTSTDPVAIGIGALMYDYTAVTLTQGPVQKGVAPAPGLGSNIFSVLPNTLPTNGYPGIVSGTSGGAAPLPILTRAGVDAWWTPVTPPSALTVADQGSVGILDATQMQTYLGPLQMTRDLTMEAWLSPSAFTPNTQSTVLIFNNTTHKCNYLLALDPDGKLFAGNDLKMVRATGSALALNTWTHVAASYVTDFGVMLSGTKYMDAGADTTLDTPEALTVEGWVKLDSTGARQTIAAKADDTGQTWALYVDASGKPTFDVTCVPDTGGAVSSVSGGSLPVGSWKHVAGVYDVAYKRQTVVQFNAASGSNIVIPALTHPVSQSATVEAWIQITDQAVATATQILFASTNGSDPVPLSLYLNSNVPSFDANTGTVAGITALRVGDWTHLAGVFDATSGNLSLYVNGQLVNSATGGGTPSGPPITTGAAYRMGAPVGQSAFGGLMNEVRLWNRALTTDDVRQNMMTQLNGGERGLVGYWPLSDRYGTTTMDLAGNSTGQINNAGFVQSDKGFFNHRLLVDGVEVAYAQVTAAPAVAETPLSLGANNKADFLQATIDDVRLWKVGRLDWQIDEYRQQPLPRDSEGLISEWEFSTGSGRVGFDSKSDNNAIFLDARSKMTDAVADLLWTPTTFRAGWRLFINGQETASQAFTPPVPFVAGQCQIGATQINVGVGAFYTGSIAEVRLWSQARTAEQIRDTMYEPLTGSEDRLTGYWPMNDGSGQVVADRTGGGGDGLWLGLDDAVWVNSAAPIGIEAPQVLSIPNGASRTGYQATTDYTPAAADYSDVELDAGGVDVAVMKRAYAWVSGGTLNAVTGYKVGDLVMQYVGQVQTKPTLIGYIEGAPPLPSENLTVDSPISPYKYLAASTITLTESDNTTVSYSAERDLGQNFVMDFKAGLGIEWDFRAGVLVQSLLVRGAIKAGVHGTDDKALSTLTQANISTSTNAVMAKTIEVFGAWQPNTYDFDTLVTRIYIPNNMGYALVKSGTADNYALRLKTTGAVVNYSLRPNPDIPEDTNIIMFKINPLYVKNGTLDGYVGFQTDKDYPFLTGGERGSYFKPIEAYALKQQIERAQHQALAAYDQFDATSLGRRFQEHLLNFSSPVPTGGYDIGDTSTDLTAALLQVKKGAPTDSNAWKERLARRDMVNTYVWNSDGGLYSEEEQYSAVHEESLGGSYQLTSLLGGYAEVSMSTGPQISLDALSGSIVRTKAMKQKTEGQSFGLSVTMPGEGFLNKRAPQVAMAPGEYPVTYADASCPGKVNQYRFMTFYLAPKKSNFETFWSKVVDPNWLNRQGAYVGTDDPDAFALRQAKANPNAVWRVLHRVTYVNRVPGLSGDAETLPPDVRRPDDQSIGQNIWLIDSLPVPVGDLTPLGTIYQELQPFLTGLEANPLWGSLLTAQQVTVTSDIMEYMRGVYQVPR
jgi:hypothetical protein